MHARCDEAGRGLASAMAAFVLWGLLPLFWKFFSEISAFEVLTNRIFWTAITTTGALAAMGRLREVGAIFRDKKRLRATAVASFLIAGNGVTFIWGVSNDRVTEVSLGYYINPLLNALLGFVILRERPNALQSIAIGLAALGVLFLTVREGVFPWLSLVLALCFGLYGLVRKTAPVEALPGLAGEMLLASPLALAYLLFVPAEPFGAFLTDGPQMTVLLALTGIVSALPLFLFAYGARRLEYTTVGLLMFSSPTLQLGLAVLVYDEPFTSAHAVTFTLIWTAVALYLWGMCHQREPPTSRSES